MTERKRSTVRDLRRDNRSVLLWSLFIGQPCSRQDLSWATGLSTASVSNVVREFIAEGIVAEAGLVDSDGGRPRALLRMDPDYGRVIGVDVGETRIRVEMFDMTMAMRASADYALDPRDQGIDMVVDRVQAGLASVLADGGVRSVGDPRRGYRRSRCHRARRLGDAWSTPRPTAGTRSRSAGCCGGRRFPVVHRQRGEDDGPGRALVRRRPGRSSGRGVPDGVRARSQHRHRRPRPGRHVRRGRVGSYHRGGRRAVLPLRLPGLPGGVRGRRARSSTGPGARCRARTRRRRWRRWSPPATRALTRSSTRPRCTWAPGSRIW